MLSTPTRCRPRWPRQAAAALAAAVLAAAVLAPATAAQQTTTAPSRDAHCVAAALSDVPAGHYARDAIFALADAGVLTAEDCDQTQDASAGRFNPHFQMDDVQLRRWLARYSVRSAVPTNWAAASAALKEHRGPITRAQAAVVFAAFYGTAPVYGVSPFDDVAARTVEESVGDFRTWEPSVAALKTAGIISGTSATTYSPHRRFTRSDAARFLYRYNRYRSQFTEPAAGAEIELVQTIPDGYRYNPDLDIYYSATSLLPPPCGSADRRYLSLDSGGGLNYRTVEACPVIAAANYVRADGDPSTVLSAPLGIGIWLTLAFPLGAQPPTPQHPGPTFWAWSETCYLPGGSPAQNARCARPGIDYAHIDASGAVELAFHRRDADAPIERPRLLISTYNRADRACQDPVQCPDPFGAELRVFEIVVRHDTDSTHERLERFTATIHPPLRGTQ